MLVKRLVYVSVSILCLSVAYWIVSRSVGDAHAQTITPEVTVETGTLHDGETIPLPHYADGTAALENECHWTVGIHEQTWGFTGTPYYHCSADTRVVSVYACLGPGNGVCEGVSPPTYTPGTANYIIVGVRVAVGPVSTQRQSWGYVKGRYRNR